MLGGGALKHFQDITSLETTGEEKVFGVECLVYVVGIHAFTNKEVKMQRGVIVVPLFR